ncbi:MAG: hypothetical protein VYD41_00895 [Candidatus Thermoplasmatota archaeon]|nr:hypothetical protein [Candidatus Thermoplasmatota archaeon]
MRRSVLANLFVALLLASVLSPAVSAAASIAMSADSLAKEATTDDPAEYSIIITNDGDEDLTVTLNTAQDSDCNGFTSTIDTTPFSLNEGDSEEKTLTVSVNDQASGDCVTTVNAQGTYLGGQANQDIEVTTTAEGGGQYSVKLSYITPGNGNINYDGEDDNEEWTVKVENTGEQDNSNIQLSMASASDCDSDGLEATVEPQTMNLNSGDSETATVNVDLPDGSSTDSGEHCFILEATVTNDPNTLDQANDSIELRLNIPEVKTCESSLQHNSHTLQPGDSASNEFSLTNTGNTAWTVSAFAMSQGLDVSDWVDFDTPTSRLLSEPGQSSDSTTFDFVITPDDSVEPGSVDVYIQGRAGSNVGCESLLRINLGQVRSASLSLSNPTLSNVDPGGTGETVLQVTNTGNGQDTFALGVVDLTPGWQVQLTQTTITIDGRHCTSSTSCDRENVVVQISVPVDAKAGIEYQVTFTVSSQGSTHDQISATVTVTPVHDGSIQIPSDSQTGRFGQWVAFPILLTNTGNIQDTFALTSCDPDIADDCSETKWANRYKDTDGNEISMMNLESDQEVEISLEILISDNINNKSESFEVRIGIVGTQVLLKHVLTATVSNFNYSMSVAFESPGEDPNTMAMSLPPGGSVSIPLIVTNTGDGGADDAVFTISGLDSSVVRTIKVGGIDVDGEVTVPSEGQTLVVVEFEVLEVESGTSGVITIRVTSKKNTGQLPSFLEIAMDIRAIHDLQLDMETTDFLSASYPEHMEFEIFVTNHGNIEEEIEVLTSDSLRGWTVDVVGGEEFKLDPGKTKQVKVRVTPPSNMISDDEYTFTVTVQPKGMPVAGEPIDLTVESSVGAASISSETQMVIAIAVILVGSLAITYLFARSRAENMMLSESLNVELDD